MNAAANTDRELYRERDGDFYAPSIHVTKAGGIGINVGGTVHVRTLSQWHSLVKLAQSAEESLLDIQREVDQLADFAADSVELRVGETNIVERLNEICGTVKPSPPEQPQCGDHPQTHFWDGTSPSCLCGKVAMAPVPDGKMQQVVRFLNDCPQHIKDAAKVASDAMKKFEERMEAEPLSPNTDFKTWAFSYLGGAFGKQPEPACHDMIHFQREGEAKCVCGKMALLPDREEELARMNAGIVCDQNPPLHRVKVGEHFCCCGKMCVENGELVLVFDEPDEPNETTFYLGTKCQGDSHVQIGGKDRCECGKASVPSSPEWGMEEPDIVKRDE